MYFFLTTFAHSRVKINLMKILLTLFVLLFSSSVFAEKLYIPKEYYGTWSNNCSQDDIYNYGFIFGKSGYLYFDKYNSDSDYTDGNYSIQFTNINKYQNWNIIKSDIFGNTPLYTILDNDKLILIPEPEDRDPLNFNFLKNFEKEEAWFKCDKIPPNISLLFGETLSFLNSDYSLSCINNDKNIEKCAVDVFNFLDASKNKALSIAEITRGTRLLISIINLTGDNGDYNDKENKWSMASTYLLSPILAKILLTNFDFNNSEDLTISELIKDRENLFGIDSFKRTDLNFNDDKIKQQINEFIIQLDFLKNLF